MGTRVPEGADVAPLETPLHREPLETLVSRAPWAGLISTVSAARRSTNLPVRGGGPALVIGSSQSGRRASWRRRCRLMHRRFEPMAAPGAVCSSEPAPLHRTCSSQPTDAPEAKSARVDRGVEFP